MFQRVFFILLGIFFCLIALAMPLTLQTIYLYGADEIHAWMEMLTLQTVML